MDFIGYIHTIFLIHSLKLHMVTVLVFSKFTVALEKEKKKNVKPKLATRKAEEVITHFLEG